MPLNNITTFLWFDKQAAEAAAFYVSIFSNSRITRTQTYLSAAQSVGYEAGDVMTVEFELNGHQFAALNGGPHFTFNEAVSFQIDCKDQGEVDYYWEKLGEGGDPKRQQCGWVADRFGVAWQVTPTVLPELLGDADRVKANRAMEAMLGMKKLDVAALQKAFDG